MIEHIDSNDELHWLAFHYVAGEMTDFEQNLFEKRLAADQDAREAVEQALELQQAVALVSAEPRFAFRSVRLACRRPVAWAGTAAACLFLAVCLAWLVRPNAPLTKSTSTAKDSPSLASAWTDIRHARITEDSGFGLTERIDAPLPAQAASGITENEQPDAIPSWLLAAVFAETQQIKEKP